MRHGFGSMSSIPVTGASKTEAPLECNYRGGVRPQILFGGGWEDNWRIVGYTVYRDHGSEGGGRGRQTGIHCLHNSKHSVLNC